MKKDYFKIINTEEKAYWLGFIMADGCVTKTSSTCKSNNRLQITLSTKDRCILEKLVKSLCSKDNIRDTISSGYSSTPISILCVNSIELCNDLSKCGISSNKTGNETLPEIEDHLIRHFIRGFFDGDGTSFISRGYVTIGFTSGEDFLQKLNSYLSSKLDIEEKKIYLESNTTNAYRLYYNKGEEVNKIFNYLYDDCSIYLERKYLKLKEDLAPQNEKSTYLNKLKESNKIFQQNVIKLRQNHNLKQKDLAEAIGVTLSKMNKLEKSAKTIDTEVAKLIADYFKVDHNNLIFSTI